MSIPVFKMEIDMDALDRRVVVQCIATNCRNNRMQCIYRAKPGFFCDHKSIQVGADGRCARYEPVEKEGEG